MEADKDDLFGDAAEGRAAHAAGPRSVTGELTADDLEVDRTLRPKTLDDYCGQERVRENLRVLIQAAKERNEPLDHVIFSGPPGLGKTTLAGIVANEMGRSCTRRRVPQSSARVTSRQYSRTSRRGRPLCGRDPA